jgi:VRR-NUC domain
LPRRHLGPALPLEDISEKEWMSQGVQLAKQLGWKRFHPYRSDRSEPGWPDDALVRERLILIEWKTEKGMLSDAQKDWIGRLLKAEVEVYVARPRHLEDLAHVLQSRERPDWVQASKGLSIQPIAMRDETRAVCGLD